MPPLANRITAEVVELKYALVGGDARTAHLAQSLARDGHRVCAFALEKADLTSAVTKTGCLQGCVYGADCVVLPVPAENGGAVNAPLSENVLTMTETISALWPGQVLIGGRLGAECGALGQRAGVHIIDILKRPEFLAQNAALTAECALGVLIEQSETAIFKSRALVCGWGRIGRVLALRLAALGAGVTVAARAALDRAEARALGLGACDYGELESELGGYAFIINTVPARVLTDAMLCLVSENALILELASPPGGFDRSLAANVGLRAVYAPGLPGKLAAKSAAELLKAEIYDILREQEEQP